MACNCSFNGLCTRSISVFEPLTCDEHQLLTAAVKHLDFKKGDRIFQEAEPADKITIIRFGKIKLSRFNLDGKEIVIDILVKKDIYGEQNIFAGNLYDVNATALEATGICQISLEELQKLMLKHPEIGIKVLGVVGAKLATANELVSLLSVNDAKARLAGFLLFRSKRLHGQPITLTRDDIAAYINLRRETISRKLSDMQTDGIIQLEGQKTIKILAPELLREIFEK